MNDCEERKELTSNNRAFERPTYNKFISNLLM